MVKNVTRIRYETAGLLGIIKEVSMTVFGQNEPLTEAEFDRLTEFLKGCAGGKAMNVEELDGFFAALVADPKSPCPASTCRGYSAARGRTAMSLAALRR